MAEKGAKRDYSLTGSQSNVAIERGLVSAEWYRPEVPRSVMKELMKREDGPAIRDTLIWLVCISAAAATAYMTWESWWSLPAFAVYGLLYSSANDARWHESGHGTAFKTPWMNKVLYAVSSFATMREPEVWRWSHARHHTDTIIVGRDPEIVAMRPPEMFRFLLNFLGIPNAIAGSRSLLRHAFGRMGKDEQTFIPEGEWGPMIRTARMFLLVHLAIVALAISTRSILPMLFVGPLPSMYGAWLAYYLGVTQHVGLAEDVLDHRLNARTIYMNPVLRFLYWNMNYHIEHHMFPMVPYHRLPDLHQLIKGDLPPVYPSSLAAWREIIGAIRIQVWKDSEFFVKRPIPGSPVVTETSHGADA